MGFLSDLLDKARLRPRHDPGERPPLEEAIEEILSDFQAELAGETEPKPGTWIFQRRPDRGLYVRALVQLFAEEAEEAASRAFEKAVVNAALSCACKCREHQKHGCPKCLAVERCPVHSEVDPTSLERIP